MYLSNRQLTSRIKGPGTLTFYVPPQALATSATFVDPATNATEVVFIQPLGGTCAEFLFPTSSVTNTVSGNAVAPPDPTSTTGPCPDEEQFLCSGIIVKSAEKVQDILNGVTLASQSLQIIAKSLEITPVRKRGELIQRNAAIANTFSEILTGLREIFSSLDKALPIITYTPVLPPGCDTDAVVVACKSSGPCRCHILLKVFLCCSGPVREGAPNFAQHPHRQIRFA